MAQHCARRAAGPSSRAPPSRANPVRLEVAPELVFGDLGRRAELHRHLDLDRVVLARRITFPVVGHEDAPQIGVAGEHHAEQVVDLALVPVRVRPDPLDRRQPAALPETRTLRRSRWVAEVPERGHAERWRGGRPPRSADPSASSRPRSCRRASAKLQLGGVAERAAGVDERRAPTDDDDSLIAGSQLSSVTPGRARSSAAAMSAAAMRRHGYANARLLGDLPLQLHDAVDERLGPRRTAGHEDVDRHDLVDALDDARSCRTRRRSTRRRPSRSPTSARASGRRPGGAPGPSSATGGRRRSSGRTAAASRGTPRRRSARCRSAPRPWPSSRWRSRRGRRPPARWPSGGPSGPSCRPWSSGPEFRVLSVRVGS